MEEVQGSKRKRESLVSDCNVDSIFGILVAALSGPTNHHSLIKKCLNSLRLSLVSGTHRSLPTSILALIPLLLTSKSSSIVSRTAQFVGMASLTSFEANQQIALDSHILKVIVSVSVRLTKRSVAIDACHAILDVATTSLGRRSLLQLAALETLIWEGFLHVAIHCWNQNQKQPKHTSCSFQSQIQGWHYVNQETIFSQLIDKVHAESRFLEAVRGIEVAISKKQDPFQRMRWLQAFMDQEGEAMEGIDRDLPFMRIEDVISLCAEDIYKAEAVFTQVKSRFCGEVLFGDVTENYEMLLQKFKKTRQEYMNGMLSLHGN